MNNMYSFNPDEKRVRMAQALENYILPEQKLQMPQTSSSGGGMSPMDLMKMMDKKKKQNPYGSDTSAKDASTPTDLNVYQESQ
jgi:hypothetical protein